MAAFMLIFVSQKIMAASLLTINFDFVNNKKAAPMLIKLAVSIFIKNGSFYGYNKWQLLFLK